MFWKCISKIFTGEVVNTYIFAYGENASELRVILLKNDMELTDNPLTVKLYQTVHFTSIIYLKNNKLQSALQLLLTALIEWMKEMNEDI